MYCRQMQPPINYPTTSKDINYQDNNEAIPDNHEPKSQFSQFPSCNNFLIKYITK